MTRGAGRLRSGCALLLALWTTCARPATSAPAVPAAPAAADTYQVLIVSPYSPSLAGVDLYIRTASARLNALGVRSDHIHVEYLDLEQHPSPAYREAQRRMMRMKYDGQRIDAVLAMMQPALDFMERDVPELAAGAPMLAIRANAEALAAAGRRIVETSQHIDYDTSFAQALALFPDTRQVLLFLGDTPEERRELLRMRAALSRLPRRLQVADTSGMTLAQACERAARLPRDSIVLDYGMQHDAAGNTYASHDTRAAVARATAAPAFMVYDVQLGSNGAVGGYVISVAENAAKTAAMAFDIMRGKTVLNEAVTHLNFSQVPMYDWAQLRRHGADPGVLPTDTLFVNRTPTLWGQYRTLVLATGAVMLALTGLAVALSWQVRRKARAERALLRSEERYRNLVERAPEAILVVDPASRLIVEHNSKAEQLFGRSRQELLSSGLVELLALPGQPIGRLTDNIAANAMRALDGEVVVYERAILRPDGTEVIAEVWLSRLAGGRAGGDADDGASGLVRASLVDITARRHAEEALQSYRRDLERQVDERTAALSVALEQAQAASRAKNVFLSNMSHEVRTPMNAILGYAQLLANMPDPEGRRHEYIGAIVQGGEQLLRLMDGVLEMSRIDAGTVKLALAPVQPGALLREAGALLAPQAAEKGLRFEIDVGPEVPRVVEADGAKLHRIFLSLIENAVKFTVRGRVRASLSARPLEDGAVRLIAEVEDTGVGITPPEQARLFDAFEQASAGRGKGGAGLGLALGRQLARIMGGDVELRRTGPDGTIMHFAFDAKVVVAQDLPDLDHAPGPACARPRILVVDDVAANRALLAAMLGDAGFDQVREVDRGGAVHEAVAAWPADLVLLDRRLADLDGLAVARALRADAATRDVRIVIVTAGAADEERPAAFAAGADGFIAKPLREAELLAEIARLFPAVRPAAPGASAARPEPIGPALAVRLAELIEAGNALQFERCLAEELRDTHPATYRQLLELVRKFDYARILALLMPESA